MTDCVCRHMHRLQVGDTLIQDNANKGIVAFFRSAVPALTIALLVGGVGMPILTSLSGFRHIHNRSSAVGAMPAFQAVIGWHGISGKVPEDVWSQCASFFSLCPGIGSLGKGLV